MSAADAPADAIEPFLVIALILRAIFWRRRRRGPREALRQRLQPNRLPALVHALRILDQIGPQIAVLVGLKLGAVDLGPSLEHADAVFEHRRLPQRKKATVGRLLKMTQTGALEFRQADRMLRDQP